MKNKHVFEIMPGLSITRKKYGKIFTGMCKYCKFMCWIDEFGKIVYYCGYGKIKRNSCITPNEKIIKNIIE